MKWFNNVFWTKWKVIRTIWPYPEGWGVYRRNWLTGHRTILETGLTKSYAQEIADYENKATEHGTT